MERVHCRTRALRRSYLVAAHAVGKPARLERSPLLEKFDPGGARHATDSRPIRSLFYKRRDAKERVSADTTGTRSGYLRFLARIRSFFGRVARDVAKVKRNRDRSAIRSTRDAHALRRPSPTGRQRLPRSFQRLSIERF